MAIHYCNQSAWAISLELNMASSVFIFLILFWEVPWSWILSFVQATKATTGGMFVTQFCYTIIIAMAGYQYYSYLYNIKIHKWRYTFVYCLLSYYDYVIFIMFHFKMSRKFAFITNIESVDLCCILTQQFSSRQRNSLF